jgi:hypothetical protein
MVFSSEGRLLAAVTGHALRLWEATTGRPGGVLVPLRNAQQLLIAADGHYRGTPRIEREFVYVVQTDHGQATLTPEEFAKRYGWQNDPARVQLTGR